MAESDDLYAEVRQMRLEQEQQGGMLDALVRGNPELKDKVLEAVTKDDLMKLLYQLVDGKLSQKQILAEVQRRNTTKSSPMSVSRKLEKLRDELDLIFMSGTKQGSPVYRHTRLARVLGVTRAVGKLEKA